MDTNQLGESNGTISSKSKLSMNSQDNKHSSRDTKPEDSASEGDNSDASSDDTSDEKEGAETSKQCIVGDGEDDEDDEDDDDEKVKTDDADEHSDTAAQRQSKRKPSKSRIKRIIPQPTASQPPVTASTPVPLPSVDSLMMLGAHSPLLSQVSMVTSPAQAFMHMAVNSQQRTPGAYKCDICGKEFRVPSRYESHMLSHSKGKPFCCDVCGKLFASQLKLEVHRPVHSRNRKDSFACPTCGHECTNWRAYLYHVAKHTSNGGKKHNCQVCGRQFHAAQRLRNHMQSHMDGKNYCCLKCGKLFESQKRLSIHAIIHDAERREPFSCVDCGKVYDDWRAFKQHMKTHGSDGVIYRCEICSAQFITQYEKEKHKRVHTSNQRYQCHHCDKCFRSQSQLAVHERKHQGNKSHECTICGRECARAFSLKQHMKMHAGEKEFFCHLCGGTFKKAEELAAHSLTHAGEREFTCDQCGKCFAKKIHYHRHLMVHAAGHHFSCGLCGKKFENQIQLRTHTTTHKSGRKQRYACLACSDAFNTQLELEAHAHTHGKSPPYVCGLCGKLFAEQRYFRQHMKRHTARSMKQKLQAQSSMTPIGKSSGISVSTPSSSTMSHKCHMCGQQFAQRQSLISHIEEHKRSGLLMYFNLIDGKIKNAAVAAQQKQQASADSSDDESETASDSEGSDDLMNRSKTTIHYGMQTTTPTATPVKGSNNINNKSSLTEAAERAMALRMQAVGMESQNSSISNNNTVSSGRPSVIKSDPASVTMDGSESDINQSGNFYSSPVFPGQLPGNHATPYHAAAQPFQHNSQGDYVEGSSHGAPDITGQYPSLQKGLPGFADFRRQLGYSNNAGYIDYADAMSAAGQYAAVNQMPTASGGYSTQGMMPPPSGFLPDTRKQQMSGSYDPSASMYPDMKMSVFPGMPPPGQGDMSLTSQGPNPNMNMQPPQFDPMLQFQPLGS